MGSVKVNLGAWYLLGFGVWVVQKKDDGKFIGTCGFWQGKDWPIELTWWLLPETRRKGFAYESSLAVIDYAYKNLGWGKVETYMNDENVSARSLVEKLGGVKDRRAIMPDGIERNVFIIPEPANLLNK